MLNFSPRLPSHPVLLAAIFSTALSGAALASTLTVAGSFVPEGKAATSVSGSVSGSFDTATDELAYIITYKGLSGPVIAAHFHGPARPGASADVLKPIDGPYDSPIKGHVTFDRPQAEALQQGLVYVNLHTVANPGGEARAQLRLEPQK